MMGKYSMDSFMQMAMGINMNEELKDFRNFEDHPAVKVSEKFKKSLKISKKRLKISKKS